MVLVLFPSSSLGGRIVWPLIDVVPICIGETPMTTTLSVGEFSPAGTSPGWDLPGWDLPGWDLSG
jgi:hypothetical protein